MKASWFIALVLLTIPSLTQAEADGSGAVPSGQQSVQPTAAQDIEPKISLQAPNEVDLGSPINATLTVTTAINDNASLSKQPLTSFETLSKKTTVKAAEDGQTHTFTFDLKLISFEIGKHTLGPLKVRISGGQGELRYLESEEKTIDIRSLLESESNPQLQSPSQPVTVEEEDYQILIAIGGILALGLAFLIAQKLLRSRQKRVNPQPIGPPPLPPWEVATEELITLKQQRVSMLQKGQTEAWVDAVSDTIRRYLGERYHFPGLESTTNEIEGQLKRTAILDFEIKDAIDFLEECDLVKFARAELADEASKILLQDAFNLVEKTKPAPISAGGVQ